MKRKIYYIVSMLITAGFIALSATEYAPVFTRTKETLKDICSSLRYYYLTLFKNAENVSASVVCVSKIDISGLLSITEAELVGAFDTFFETLFRPDNIAGYILSLSDLWLVSTTILVTGIFLSFVLKALISGAMKRANNDYDKDTAALAAFKRAEQVLKIPINEAREYLRFVRGSRIKNLWVVIWVYNLNLFTISGEAFAYIIYLTASFDLSSVYVAAYKGVIDLYLAATALPWQAWIPVLYYFVVGYRKKRGLRRLIKNEHKNCGFIKGLGVATMFTAPMNGGKTKTVTDIALSLTNIFKTDALDTMRKLDLRFPHFPFILLERKLRNLIAKRTIYSLASIEEYFKWKKRYFYYTVKTHEKLWCVTPESILFGYDYEKYGLYFDNGLYRTDIFDAITAYSKAYYIYSMKDSFIVSNYAIREDRVTEDIGNMPVNVNGFFYGSTADSERNSHYSRILDFDILRKGKKIEPLNPLADTFEFGVVAITEFDKDRGNTLDTKELKKAAEETNQKNDLFNYSPKMARHSATIEFKPYVRYLFDLQRAMKTEADLREICDCIIQVGDADKGLLAMPLFFVEETLYGILKPIYDSFYETYRFYRGDNTLFAYIMKKTVGRFITYYDKVYNRYGYDVQRLKIENGKLDGKVKKHKYYEAYGKIHANRYSTDCYREFLKDGVLKKGKGISDYPTYESHCATKKELSSQHSYFIRDLEKASDGEKERNI